MQKVDFIAEVSSNHNQDLNRMKEFIHASKDVGCAGVKFQLFKIDKLFAPEILENSATHRSRKKWELSTEDIPELADLAHSLGLSFSCTPFYLEAVAELNPYVDYYKIASYELLWTKLFKHCGDMGKPVVFSTGMATIDEVKKALTTLVKTRCQEITVLHCNSAYPTPIKDANLESIHTLQTLITDIEIPNDKKVNVGYSDHTVSPAVIYRAVHRYKSTFVEFHMDIDGEGEEYKAGHCWLPENIAHVISNVNFGLESDGNKKFGPSPSEMPDREWRTDPIDGLRPIKNIRKGYV